MSPDEAEAQCCIELDTAHQLLVREEAESWREIDDESKRVIGLPITSEGEARRQATPRSMAAASGQSDRIPSIEALPALYHQRASPAPSNAAVLASLR